MHRLITIPLLLSALTPCACDTGALDDATATSTSSAPATTSESVPTTTNTETYVSETGSDDTTGPTLAVCGNNVKEPGEGCDDGTTMQTATCEADCYKIPECGDNILNMLAGEGCDDGTKMQNGICEANCLKTPECGDNILNSHVGEMCDDGNKVDGDGCSKTCLIEQRWVFASSALYNGSMNKAPNEMLKGIALADANCNALAQAAGLTANFKAWLSDGMTWPKMRFHTNFTGYYRLRSNGFPIVANGWGDLTDGSLAQAINADEYGNDALGTVWTNTKPDGTRATVNDCSGWTVITGNTPQIIIGLSSEDGTNWTYLENAPVLCVSSNRLYCFEDPL